MYEVNLWAKSNWYPIKNVKSNIRRFFQCIKWSVQRIKRGYSDADLWNLDGYLACTVGNALLDLSKITTGYPDKIVNSYEEWQEKLNNIGNTLITTSNWDDKNVPYAKEYTEIIDKHPMEYEEMPGGFWKIKPIAFTAEEQVIVDKYHQAFLEYNNTITQDRQQALQDLISIWNYLYD